MTSESPDSRLCRGFLCANTAGARREPGGSTCQFRKLATRLWVPISSP